MQGALIAEVPRLQSPKGAPHAYIGEVLSNLDSALLCAAGMPDQIHLLVSLSPKFAVADVVRDIKAKPPFGLRSAAYPTLSTIAAA